MGALWVVPKVATTEDSMGTQWENRWVEKLDVKKAAHLAHQMAAKMANRRAVYWVCCWVDQKDGPSADWMAW